MLFRRWAPLSSRGPIFLLYWLFDAVIMFLLVVLVRRKAAAEHRIAIVRLDAIGDFFVWLDSAQYYKELYPESNMVLIGNATWSDFAISLGFWDEVWAVDSKKFVRDFIYRFKILLKTYNANFSVVIQPAISRGFIYGDSIVKASNAKERIGSAGDFVNISKVAKIISDNWYTNLIELRDVDSSELERNSDFASALVGRKLQPCLKSINGNLTDGVLNGFNYSSEKYVVLFPGASWEGRRWPVERFARVGDWIFDNYGLKLVLCGSSSECELSQALMRDLTSPVINFCGQTSLQYLVDIIRCAKLVVSNETSAIHIASAVGTLSVCILGGGHYGKFLPYSIKIHGAQPEAAVCPMTCFGCNWSCTFKRNADEAVKCIQKISEVDVIRLVDLQLSRYIS